MGGGEADRVRRLTLAPDLEDGHERVPVRRERGFDDRAMRAGSGRAVERDLARDDLAVGRDDVDLVGDDGVDAAPAADLVATAPDDVDQVAAGRPLHALRPTVAQNGRRASPGWERHQQDEHEKDAP